MIIYKKSCDFQIGQNLTIIRILSLFEIDDAFLRAFTVGSLSSDEQKKKMKTS